MAEEDEHPGQFAEDDEEHEQPRTKRAKARAVAEDEAEEAGEGEEEEEEYVESEGSGDNVDSSEEEEEGQDEFEQDGFVVDEVDEEGEEGSDDEGVKKKRKKKRRTSLKLDEEDYDLLEEHNVKVGAGSVPCMHMPCMGCMQLSSRCCGCMHAYKGLMLRPAKVLLASIVQCVYSCMFSSSWRLTTQLWLGVGGLAAGMSQSYCCWRYCFRSCSSCQIQRDAKTSAAWLLHAPCAGRTAHRPQAPEACRGGAPP